MQPVFSIITITYNAESTLERTIKSVINQRYPYIEYIIVDGASTDGTLALAEKYRTKISKIISEKDKGIYDAMNKGLALATGDYIWFMNAGDTIFSPDTTGSIAEITDMFPDIIYGETVVTDNAGNCLYMRRLKAPKKLAWRSFRKGMLVCHQSFIVRRDIALEYDLKYRFSADFEWCIRCMKSASNIYNTNLVLATYLNEGVTTQNMKASLKERFSIMCKYYGTIQTCLFHVAFALRFGLAKLNNSRFF
jgi:glycosyltransferase involved in cell wall biosynthesis